MWTADGNWMGWEEVCKGCEESVFADEKGIWGKEEGDGRVFNSFGMMVIGDDEEKKKKLNDKRTEKEKK